MSSVEMFDDCIGEYVPPQLLTKKKPAIFFWYYEIVIIYTFQIQNIRMKTIEKANNGLNSKEKTKQKQTNKQTENKPTKAKRTDVFFWLRIDVIHLESFEISQQMQEFIRSIAAFQITVFKKKMFTWFPS